MKAVHAMQNSGRKVDCLGPAPGDMWPWTRANATLTNNWIKVRGPYNLLEWGNASYARKIVF